MRFAHETLPQRVVFAPNEAAGAFGDEVTRLGAERVMVITAPSSASLADAFTDALRVAHVHDEIVAHVPVEVAERARDAAEKSRAALVSVGGGSATGLAKAVAVTVGLPLIAVPTTYAGSEATDVWGDSPEERPRRPTSTPRLSRAPTSPRSCGRPGKEPYPDRPFRRRRTRCEPGAAGP
ncbi:iron-containing alcohol dehydrogenase [Streptomyces ureilyticus]|uniref:iron-containing alcohol dehydrogenase n=1 Tax=Streptomyces ureilyticus TaxID=1775131 RepID=UPI002E2B2EB4|nr:iron-containing alcohol dehydrogenase [Streptomyces ureilyticus]